MQAMENRGVAGGDGGVDDVQGVLVDSDQQLLQQPALPARAAGGDEHIQAAHMKAHVGPQVGLQTRFTTGRRQRRNGRHGHRVATVVYQRQPVRHKRLRQCVNAVERAQCPRCHHLLPLLRQHIQFHLQRFNILNDLPDHRGFVRLHPPHSILY